MNASLPLFVLCAGASQEDITKSVDALWADRPPVSGAVALSVIYEERPPDSGTRTRVWPEGEPFARSLLGRCERAIIEAGVVRARSQVVDEHVVKRYGSRDSLRFAVVAA